MNKRKIMHVLLILLCDISLLVGCQHKSNTTEILPPKEELVFETTQLLCYNPRSTLYSLGDVGGTFTLTEDTLTTTSFGEEQVYSIAYTKETLDVEAFEKEIQTLESHQEIDISEYKECFQYNLCKGTNEEPGYRLYQFDDEYWMGVLYHNALWRCVYIEPVD